MNDTLRAQLKSLHLNNLLAHWDEAVAQAAEQRWSHERFLTHLIEQEYRFKQERARQLRRHCAHIPEPWVIETFPFAQQPKLNQKKIMALYDSSSYLQNRQNIIWLGGTGCGKTGLATSFLIHALDLGYRGRYVLFADLIAQFYRSAADHSEQKVLKGYLAWDILLIDEIGYVDVEPAQV